MMKTSRTLTLALALALAATTSAQAALNLASEQQKQASFAAAFGGNPTSPNETGTLNYRADTMVWLPNGLAALVSAGSVLPDEAGHVSSGTLAVHYLRPVGEDFAVETAVLNAGGRTSFGVEPTVSASSAFSANPVIFTEGGGTWQGYTCGWGELIELTPTGPVSAASFPVSYDNTGAVGDGSGATTITGKLANIRKGKSFQIVYQGSRNFTETYVRKAGKYKLTGRRTSRMETC